MAEPDIIHPRSSLKLSETLPEIVHELCAQHDRLATPLRKTFRGHHLPSRDEVVAIFEGLRSVIFPGYFGNRDVTEESLGFHIGAILDRVAMQMVEEIHRGLCFECAVPDSDRMPTQCLQRARDITVHFLRRLPELRRLLALDAMAAYNGDPAARSPAEAIFCYPGVLALTSHRIAHELHLLDVPVIPRIISEHAHSLTGIDIHPGATIGESFFVDHGTGVVIGETCEIGDHVRLYQGVTLGAKSFPLDESGNPIKGIARHPIIENRVTIYSGATILGRVTIGEGAVIGGNVWLTRSVPAGARIAQVRPQPDDFADGGGI